MKRKLLRGLVAVALGMVVATSNLPADARKAPSRPHSSGSSASGHSGGRSSTPSAPSTRRVPARPRGEGYHGGGDHGWGYYPYYWDWYYPPWWSVGLWWGWPEYYSYPWYDGPWYGRPYGYPGPRASGVEEEAYGSALVETKVRPKKAGVILDGEEIGQARDFNGTWDALELSAGRHVFRFEAPGYMALEVGVEARDGERYVLAYDLRRGEGQDPRSNSLLPPPAAAPPSEGPGTSEGAARLPEEKAVPRETGKSVAATGFMKFDVLPPDAAVYLDHEFLGRADELGRLHGAIAVATGMHRIEAVRPGYRSHVETVVVDAGPRPAEIRIRLEQENR
jgi:hypothetical protein